MLNDNLPTRIHDAYGKLLRKTSPDPGRGLAIPTGFFDLDFLTGGLCQSELTLLVSRPGMNKKALALNIVEHMTIAEGLPTLYVSLDFAKAELANHLLCSLARVNITKYWAGFLSKEDHRKLSGASPRLEQAPLFVDDTPNHSLPEIAACARSMKQKEQIGLLIIDYLQLILPEDPHEHRHKQLAEMARGLKALACELKIPVLCLTQLTLNPEIANPDAQPCPAHLSALGAIDRSADQVIFIRRPDYHQEVLMHQEPETPKQVELWVAKQSGGPGSCVIISWCDNYSRFDNWPPTPGSNPKLESVTEHSHSQQRTEETVNMIQWEIPGHLARSSRPGYSLGRGEVNQAVVDAWLDEAHGLGIKSIICLLADEHLKLYRDLPLGGDLVGYYRSQGFEVAHIPVLDYQQPPLSEENLRQVDAAYEKLPKPVLIHCSAGIDRTGRAIAYLQKTHHDGR